ncbi:MAG TPA: OmpA family protein [Terriglobales bacterium]|nr:OmpA family protein [Terriglobales bacterium]
MKKQTWMALALAAAMAVPAAAQQTSNDQNTQQPAASSSQTMQQQATTQQGQGDQTGMEARQPLQPDTREGFWGKLNPFARKKYVQRQMSPIRNRVNELDELSAKNSRAISDVDQRAQEGIRMADAKATQADQHAVEAGNRAQMANQTAQQASTRLTTVEQVVTNIDQYKPVTQTEIRFRAGQSVLSQKAKEALDQMAEPLKNQRGYVIEVQGFSSGRGQAAIENSQRMADAVVRYLVIEHEIPVFRIYTLGMGNAPRQVAADGSKPRRTTGGRVEISLLKNDLEQLSAQNVAPATSTEGGVAGTTTGAPTAQGQQYQQPGMSQPATPAQQPAQQTPPQR